ncbi:uncharacterized protein [Cherax quadricarinatus]
MLGNYNRKLRVSFMLLFLVLLVVIVNKIHTHLFAIMTFNSLWNITVPTFLDWPFASTCILRVNLDQCRCTRTLQLDKSSCPSQVFLMNKNSYTGARRAVEGVESSGKSQNQSRCSSWSTQRGPGQKVVSYSVYGEFPGEYHRGLELLIPQVARMYPGWVIRLHLDLKQEQQREWACRLACNYDHLDLCDSTNITGVGDVRGSTPTTWRFCVVGDPLVNRYIVRDADSPILQREVDAVQQWITSGKCFHVMRDNKHHGVNMLAGTWGGCNTWYLSKATSVRDSMLTNAREWNYDQVVLSQHMWPWASGNVLVHDSYTCERFPGSLPFPSQRVNDTFVGMRTYRKEFANDGVRNECPVACRPKTHKDWKYC